MCSVLTLQYRKSIVFSSNSSPSLNESVTLLLVVSYILIFMTILSPSCEHITSDVMLFPYCLTDGEQPVKIYMFRNVNKIMF